MRLRKTPLSVLAVLALGFMAATALAQDAPPNYVEIRAAVYEDGFYRYAEYTRVFPNGSVIDVVYFGVPEQNELYLGAGYQLRATPTLLVTPLFYAVLGKENRERGAALGAFVLGTIRSWSIYSFLGYFEPIEGSVPRYLFLDSADVSRKIEEWEIGVSTGLFYTSGTHSFLLGPVLVRNDERGAWRLYLRGGSTVEARIARTLSF